MENIFDLLQNRRQNRWSGSVFRGHSRNAKDSRDLFGYDMSFMYQDAFGMKQEYTDRGIRRRALLALGKVDYAFPDMMKFTLCYATIVYATNCPNVKLFF